MSKYYMLVIEVLERMSGLSEAEILGGRNELCSDYRSMLVELLSKRYSNCEMTRLTGLSRQSVSRIAAAHASRLKNRYSMRMSMRDAEREVEAMNE